MKTIPDTSKRPRGFTLVEVMVALAVTAFGLLGLAKLQATVFAGAKTAGSRSIAANEAAGMASAMHANTLFWQSTAATATAVTVSAGGSTPTVSIGSYTDCTSTVCSASQMATYDLTIFGQQVNAQLPAPLSTAVSPISISCSVASDALTTNPNVCTITVAWSEQYTGSATTGTLTAANAQSTQTYTLVVQP